METFDKVWYSLAGCTEKFLKLETTTQLDVLQIIAVLIFVVHLHKMLPVEVGIHFVLLQKYAILVTYHFGARLFEICGSAKDVFSTPLLPALLVFIEWFVYSPDMIIEGNASHVINQKLENRIDRARWSLWRNCLGFLHTTLAGKNLQGHADILTAYKKNSECLDRVALWEDSALQGFAPLGPVRCALKLSRPVSFRFDENKNRITRIADAALKAMRLERRRYWGH